MADSTSVQTLYDGPGETVVVLRKGKTGDLRLTTVGHTAGDRYCLYLHLKKRTA